VVTEGTLVS